MAVFIVIVIIVVVAIVVYRANSSSSSSGGSGAADSFLRGRSAFIEKYNQEIFGSIGRSDDESFKKVEGFIDKLIDPRIAPFEAQFAEFGITDADDRKRESKVKHDKTVLAELASYYKECRSKGSIDVSKAESIFDKRSSAV